MLSVEPCSGATTSSSKPDSLMFAFSSRCFAVGDVVVAHSLTGRTDLNGHEGTVVSLMAEITLCCGDKWSSSASRLTNHPNALWRNSRQICPRQPRRNYKWLLHGFQPSRASLHILSSTGPKNCSMVTFPSGSVRDPVLGQCANGVAFQIRGTMLDVKPYHMKQDISCLFYMGTKRGAYSSYTAAQS